MFTLEKVESKEFNKTDMLKGAFGNLVTRSMEAGNLDAFIFNTDLARLCDEDVPFTVNIFELYNKEKDNMREFGGKEFPISYDAKSTIQGDDIREYIDQEEITEVSIENIANIDETYFNINYSYIDELDISARITVEDYMIDEAYHSVMFYLNNVIEIDNTHRIGNRKNIIHSVTNLIGKVDFNIDIMDTDIVDMQAIVIIPRLANMSPLLYGYLDIDGELYRITSGEYCIDTSVIFDEDID